MKVKQLSFSSWVSGYYESANKAYDILKITENFEARFAARSIGEFDTFKEAQDYCQKHFEKFILASIEVENEG